MQLVLLFALQLLGAVACQAAGIRSTPSQALGFLVGLALAVVLALPVLLIGAFTVPVMATVLVAAVLGLAWIARDRLDPLVTIAWALGFTAACTPFALHDFSILTYDSHVFLDYAARLRDTHGLPVDGIDFETRGIFQIVAHALSDETFALTPAFSISLGATFALCLDRALRDQPRRWIGIAIVILVMIAIPMVRTHALFIHTNWASAGYWFVAVALLYLAEVEQDRSYLPIAFLALLAYALNRVENPMFAAVFLALAVVTTRFERRTFALPLLVFTALLVGWLGFLISVVPAESLHLTPAKGLLMIGALVAVALAFLIRDVFTRVLPYALPAIAIASTVGVLAIVLVNRDAFLESFGNWQGDLWLRPYWGYFAWPLFALLAIASLWFAHPQHARFIRYSIALFFLLVILLTALAPAGYYGSGRYADLNRISLHVVPLLCFYFALVFIPLRLR